MCRQNDPVSAYVRTSWTTYGGSRWCVEPGLSGGGAEVGAHSHSALPVRARARKRRGRGWRWGPLPELVVGAPWTGSAVEVSWVSRPSVLPIRMIPAPFVGEAEGQVSVAVPLDDGVRSDYYRPLTRYVLNRACLSRVNGRW
ncbi:phosphatase [Streptomyces narbonensis]